MTKKISYFSMVLFNIVFSFFLFFFILNGILFGLCFAASDKIPTIDYQIMRINIFGFSNNNGENTVSAHISILDMQGNDCAVIERSWNGSYLHVTFKTSEFYDKKYYFPEKIFNTDTTFYSDSLLNGNRGTKLTSYYLENKQCYLLGSESSFWQRKYMYLLAKFAFSPLSYIASGFSQKYSVDLSECETGIIYGIFIDSNGNISLKEQ